MISSQPVRHLLLLGVLLVGSARSGTQAFIPVGMIRARGTSLSISKEEKDFFVDMFGKLDRKIDLVSDNLKKEIELVNDNLKKEIELVNDNLKMGIDTLKDELTKQIGDVDSKVDGLHIKVDELHIKVDRVDKRTSAFAEDKVRSAASTKIGETFTKSHTMKSINDVVELVRSADHPQLPQRCTPEHQITTHTIMVNAIEPFKVSMAKSALRVVNETAHSQEFKSDVFEQARDQANAATELMDIDARVACGRLMAAINVLLTDDGTPREKMRKKLVSYLRRLERIKMAFERDADLTDPKGPGLLFCSIVASLYLHTDLDFSKSEKVKEHIAEKCDIFCYNQQMECDMRGSIKTFEDRASIICGEIKASSTAFSEAKEQMRKKADLIRYVMTILLRDHISEFDIEGQFWPMEVDDEFMENNGDVVENGMRFTVHDIREL